VTLTVAPTAAALTTADPHGAPLMAAPPGVLDASVVAHTYTVPGRDTATRETMTEGPVLAMERERRLGYSASVGACVGTWVGAVVGGAVGGRVGEVVGVAVGASVGEAVGDWVGGELGDSVGGCVGSVVGCCVGSTEGRRVGTCRGSGRRCGQDMFWRGTAG
jgi:hypothetical protein